MNSANDCVKIAGPIRLAMPIRLALAPCSWPCSLAPTCRLISASVAALAMPHSASSGMPARNHEPVARQPERREARDAEHQPDDHRPGLAEMLHRRADQAALHDHRAKPDRRHHEADGAARPSCSGTSCRARRCSAGSNARGGRGSSPPRAQCSCGCERSRISEPIGLARCQLNGARFSGGSDSGRMSSP